MNAHQRRIAARAFERKHGLGTLSFEDLRRVVRGQMPPPDEYNCDQPELMQKWARFAEPEWFPMLSEDRTRWEDYYSFVDDKWPMPDRFEPGAKNYYLWRRQRHEQEAPQWR